MVEKKYPVRPRTQAQMKQDEEDQAQAGPSSSPWSPPEDLSLQPPRRIAPFSERPDLRSRSRRWSGTAIRTADPREVRTRYRWDHSSWHGRRSISHNFDEPQSSHHEHAEDAPDGMEEEYNEDEWELVQHPQRPNVESHTRASSSDDIQDAEMDQSKTATGKLIASENEARSPNFTSEGPGNSHPRFRSGESVHSQMLSRNSPVEDLEADDAEYFVLRSAPPLSGSPFVTTAIATVRTPRSNVEVPKYLVARGAPLAASNTQAPLNAHTGGTSSVCIREVPTDLSNESPEEDRAESLRLRKTKERDANSESDTEKPLTIKQKGKQKAVNVSVNF